MQQGLDEAAIRRELHAFIAESFLLEGDAAIPEDSSLLENRILDSTGVLELVFHLEQQYGVQIADEEIVPENLDSIERLTRFVRAKLRE